MMKFSEWKAVEVLKISPCPSFQRGEILSEMTVFFDKGIIDKPGHLTSCSERMNHV
jgi:hypothetical protein